ncbi:hypothetical protein KFL_003220040 [Klebsormidium nitens]|uniref:Nonsense-mediated mRNA decay factor SMG8 n=1 Tax=Klebsormidium nitens TaxID=105231 RepID=A0A1Y1IAG0_KLENI|nr:hypothetical protein KFL_003220040 [Klebsormidium nitens]|eukprot:GAQ86942.1 hypothetical protein KFL_003220040 [Klebsormidium nitens]
MQSGRQSQPPARPAGRSRSRHRPRPPESVKAPQIQAGRRTPSTGNHEKQPPGAQQGGGSGRPVLMGHRESAGLPVSRGGVTEQAKEQGVVRPESAFQALARSGGVVVVGVVGGERNEAAHLVERFLQKQILTKPPSKGLDEYTRLKFHHDIQRGLVFVHCIAGQEPLSEEGRKTGGAGGRAAFLRDLLLLFVSCDVVLVLEERPMLNPRLLQTLRLIQSAKTTLSPFLWSIPSPHGVNSLHPPPSSSGEPFHTAPCPALLLVFPDDATEEESAFDRSRPATTRRLPSPRGQSSGSDRDEPGSYHPRSATAKRKFAATLDAQARLVLRKSRLAGGSGEGRFGGGDGRQDDGRRDEPLFRIDPNQVSVLVKPHLISPAATLESVSALLRQATNRWISSLNQGGGLEGVNGHPHETIRLDPPVAGPWEESVSVLLEGIWGVAVAGQIARGGDVTTGERMGFRSFDDWRLTWDFLLRSFSAAGSEKSSEGQGFGPETGVKDGLSGGVAGVRDRLTDTELAAQNPEVPAKAALQAALRQLHKAADPLYAYSARLCGAALPAALEEYLNNLPEHYPLMVHQQQLERAVWVMRNRGGGAALKEWVEKLESRCASIWEGGRKSCAARSLTGQPCIYCVHSLPVDGTAGDGSEGKRHSSGFCFLQACACGRSRKMREDPFDEAEARESWSSTEGCCSSDSAPVEHPGGSPFLVARLGSARDYSSGEGLVQDGFVPGHNQLTSLDFRLPARLLERISDGRDAPGAVGDGQKAAAPSGASANAEGSVTSGRGLLTSPSKHAKQKRAGGGAGGAAEFRVWVGFEYECPAGHRFLHKPVVKEPVSEKPIAEAKSEEAKDNPAAVTPPARTGQERGTAAVPLQGGGRQARAAPRARARRSGRQPGGRNAPVDLTSEEWPAIGGKAVSNEAEWPSLQSAARKGLLPTPGARPGMPLGGARKGHVDEEAGASKTRPGATWVAKNESGEKTDEVEEFPPLTSVLGKQVSAATQTPGDKNPAADVTNPPEDEKPPVTPSAPEADLPILRGCVACPPGGPGTSESGEKIAPRGAQLRRVFLVTPPGFAAFGTAPRVIVRSAGGHSEAFSSPADVTAVVRGGRSSGATSSKAANDGGGATEHEVKGVAGSPEERTASKTAAESEVTGTDSASVGSRASQREVTPLPADGFFSLLLLFIHIAEGNGSGNQLLLGSETQAVLKAGSGLRLRLAVH